MSNDDCFVLKDSSPELIAAANLPPKGRRYTKEYAVQPGGIHVDDIVLGMKLASVAITDDKDGTLADVSGANPWHEQALTVITGSKEEAHKPLTHILQNTFNLEVDIIIDITGWKGGNALDTQGYIAHNDTMIVLAYRCTTSFKDWITNLSTTSSEWEPEEDIALGHSGWFSCLDGFCSEKPRVHTGFYNNFIASAPLITQYIEPLLGPDQPPRKLYVVGHSLGAGVATMAACHFLLEHDWEFLPHKLLVVTAGGPRACKKDMRDLVQEQMKVLRPLDKAVICRLVRHQDVVPSVPPKWMGFEHLEKLVYITGDGDILINPRKDDPQTISEKELEEMEPDSDDDDERGDDCPLTDYEKVMKLIPRPLRDHCPDYYLSPLIALFQKECSVETSSQDGDEPEGEQDVDEPEGEQGGDEPEGEQDGDEPEGEQDGDEPEGEQEE